MDISPRQDEITLLRRHNEVDMYYLLREDIHRPIGNHCSQLTDQNYPPRRSAT